MHQKHILQTLKQCASQTGIPAVTLRRAVHRGELRCLRPTNGRNARILIKESELQRWLDETCASRQFVVVAKKKVPRKNEENGHVG